MRKIAIAFCLCATPSLAFDKTDALEVAALASSLLRAERLCPQYNFQTHKDEYERAIIGARAVAGDAAVDARIQSAEDAVEKLLMMGQKETFCDVMESKDAGMK